MRKLLLASVATLGLMGGAFAQPVGAPTQGQQAWPMANPTAYVNNNNNYQARALPGPLATFRRKSDMGTWRVPLAFRAENCVTAPS